MSSGGRPALEPSECGNSPMRVWKAVDEMFPEVFVVLAQAWLVSDRSLKICLGAVTFLRLLRHLADLFTQLKAI